MKTFFHPPVAVDENPLIPRIMRMGLEMARQAGKLALNCKPYLRRKPLLGSIIGLGALSFMMVGGGDEMPGLAEEARSELPSEVEVATRKIFDERFVRHGDSYYTVMVSYVPNESAALAETMAMVSKGMGENSGVFGDLESGSTEPLILGMELIELKDLKTEVAPEKIDRADELNEILWKGRVLVRAEAERRRSLDLVAWMRHLAESDEGDTLPYVGQEILFTDREAFLKSMQSGDDAEEPTESIGILGGLFGGLLGSMMTGDLFSWLEGSGWSDWEPGGDACYQNTHASLRGDQVESLTLESAEEAMPDASEATLMVLRQNFFNMGVMSRDDGTKVFLIKPDMAELRDADLLSDHPK